MARLVLPSRLELKRSVGSSSAAPVAKVIFTTALYVSPVQICPSCSHTGTPRHFHSSTTSGSASLTRARSRLSISPRQSSSSLILASISWEGDSPPCDPLCAMSVALPSSRGLDGWGSSPPPAMLPRRVHVVDTPRPVPRNRGGS